MYSTNAFRCSFLTSEQISLTEIRNYITLNFEADAKTLRPRPECLEAEAETETESHEAEAEVEARILASRPI